MIGETSVKANGDTKPDLISLLQEILNEQKITNERLEYLIHQEDWKRDWWQSQFSYPIRTSPQNKGNTY